MPLKPLRCARCGSTRLSYIKVGVDDEVAVCGMCHGVTEYAEELTDEKANEELVVQLEQLRLKRPILEEGGQYQAPRRRRGPSVLTWLMVAVAAMGLLALVFARDALVRKASSDRLDAERMMLEELTPEPSRPIAEELPAEAEELDVEEVPEAVEVPEEPSAE